VVNTSTSKAIAAEVPAAIRSKGTVTVAADATYAPNEFIAPNGHTVVGMGEERTKQFLSKILV
jgi:polar amino acid transport system substrate-binding protein